MAASLGSLVVSLGLDAAEFTSGLSKAEREGKRAMQSLQRDFEAAAKTLVALGAAAVAMGAKFIDAAANIDDMAEKTGASVEELSRLEQQARISGTSLETMEAGLIRLTKALHGGDEEAQGAGKALAALGLKADELRNKDTAQTLQLVAEELNKYQDGAGKTALALDLFGKSGAALLPILKDMANDQRLNVTLTAKQAAEAEELQKSFRRLGVEATNMGRALALEAIPPLQRIITELNEGTRAAGGFWRALLVGGSINPFNSLHENLVNYRKELRQLEAGGYGETRMARLRRTQIEFLERQQRAEALGLEGGDTAGEMQRFGLRGQKLGLDYVSPTKSGAAKKVDDTVKDRLAQITAEGKVLAEDRKAWEYLLREAAELRVGENIFGPEIIAAGLSTQDIKKKIDAAVAGSQALFDEWDRAGLEAGGFDEAGKKIDVFVDKTKVAAEEVSSFWDEAFRNMQRSASDFIYDTMQGNFKDFGSRFKATMDRMVADWIAAQALMEATAYLGKRLGGANSFGFLDSIIGGLGNMIGGTQAPAPVSDLTPRAMGGPVYPGQEYLVGERGPEIFRPRSAGVIIPNRSAGESAGVTVYQTINTPNPDGFRATLPQQAAQIRNAFSF